MALDAMIRAFMSASIKWTAWKLPMGWPNCLRSLCMADGLVKGLLGDRRTKGGHIHPAPVKGHHGQSESLPFLADQVLLAQLDVFEEQLRHIHGPVAHLVFHPADG